MPSRSERKLLRSLGGRKGRAEHGLFLAEGPHLLEELLGSGCRIRKVLHTRAAARDPETAALLERAAAAGADREEVAESELAGWADTVTPQGILAVAERPAWRWSDVASPRLLLMDGIQDPGNVGALLRTAEALGAGGAVLLPDTADAWSPKAVRAAAGSTLRLPTLRAAWEEAAGELAARGIEVWAAEAGGEPLRRGEAVPAALALALGSEGAGLSPAVSSAASRRIAVPLARPVESLNVGAAGAILMDRLFRETA